MGRLFILFALLGLGGPDALFAAEFQSKDWPMRRALRVSAAPDLYSVPMDLDIQSRSRSDLLDVRIVGKKLVEPYVIVREADIETVASVNNPSGRINLETKSSIFTMDLGRPLPFEKVDVTIPDRVYSRVTRLEISSDQKTWHPAGAGYIFRTFKESQSGFAVGLQHARYVRLVLVNNDNVPLQCNGVTFLMPKRTLQFVAHGPGPFWLYYGAPGVRPALYDETEIRAYREKGPATHPPVGAPEKNPAFHANPLHDLDAAYDRQVDSMVRTVKWVGIGVIGLFALLYLGYLVFENRPRHRHRSHRRRKRSPESGKTPGTPALPDQHHTP